MQTTWDPECPSIGKLSRMAYGHLKFQAVLRKVSGLRSSFSDEIERREPALLFSVVPVVL